MPDTKPFDVIVLGSGAAGMTAALVAALEGLSVCLLEREPLLGGTTAWSGGMVWAPGSQVAKTAGFAHDPAAVRAYLEALVPGVDEDPRMAAFLEAAPKAVDYLAEHSQVRLQPLGRYPDYYPECDGASLAGRVLEPEPFDASVLGKDLSLLRPPLPEFTLAGMMIARPDIPHFRSVFRSLRSTGVVASYLLGYGFQRLRFGRGTKLVLGNALVARLLASLRKTGVEIRLSKEVRSLTLEDARVAGVVLSDGVHLFARRGVVLATGGFGHDGKTRAALLPQALEANSATAQGARGAGIALASAVGGKLVAGAASNAFLAPVSHVRRADGSPAVYPHTVTDRAKPGLIAVDDQGTRFANEARSYHTFASALLSQQNRSRGDAGAWLICDAAFLKRYGLGAVKPMARRLEGYLKQGYITRKNSWDQLGEALALPPGRLAETVERYNLHARLGEDPAFGRGGDAYQRFLGDATVTPNPCVAPIEQPPFYALRIVPGDLGTAAGLASDPVGRVLDGDDRAIPGLYCCGADMLSVMQGAYPGPGITLGPALAFGYLIGKALASD